MDKVDEAASERLQALDPQLRRQIEIRARELWQEAGRPAVRDLDFWLQAEREIVYQSVAGEEDPLAGIEPGST